MKQARHQDVLAWTIGRDMERFFNTAELSHSVRIRIIKDKRRVWHVLSPQRMRQNNTIEVFFISTRAGLFGRTEHVNSMRLDDVVLANGLLCGAINAT